MCDLGGTDFLKPLTRKQRTAIDAAIERLGRFTGLEVQVAQ